MDGIGIATTDWERLKELLDELGISYAVESGGECCFRVKIKGEIYSPYSNDGFYTHPAKNKSEIHLDFHMGGRYERGQNGS